MKILYIGILVISNFFFVATNRVKRFSGNHLRGNWNWDLEDQFADAQTKTTSQVNWPAKGRGSSVKGKGNGNPNREGTWAPDSWSSGGDRNDGYDMGWNTVPQGNNKGSAYPDENGGEGGGDLQTLLGGVPGMDFPNFLSVPSTDFDCSLMPSPGYYGDVEAGCQVFHICQAGNRKDSFLCPVGTIFNQKYFVCDWWYNVNCSDTASYYDLNNAIYAEGNPKAEEAPVVTTEKPLPWNSQDLDRKRPTKSWGSQPPTGKQNPGRKDTPARRGSKSSDSANRDAGNSWSRSDVQKEITVSWGTSSGSTSGVFGSSTSSSSLVPTTKPVWYGIDGQPAKDQSNGMSKRTGLAETPAPFGARMRKKPAKTNVRTTTEVYEQTSKPFRGSSYGTTSTPFRSSSYGTTSTPFRSSSYGTTSTNVWRKDGGDYGPPTTQGWMKEEQVKKEGDDNWTNNINAHPTTSGWIKIEDFPETSINPTGIKGVWEQETAKRSELSDQADENTVRHRGFVKKSNESNVNGRKFREVHSQRKQWDRWQTFRNDQNSKTSNRGWVKNNLESQNVFESSNTGTTQRQKKWK